jgi:hypothetical protein
LSSKVILSAVVGTASEEAFEAACSRAGIKKASAIVPQEAGMILGGYLRGLGVERIGVERIGVDGVERIGVERIGVDGVERIGVDLAAAKYGPICFSGIGSTLD